VTEGPQEMFGKLMSISDDLMWRYYTLLTDLSPDEVRQIRNRVASAELHPKQAKIDLARRIVHDFHGQERAEDAAREFERRFTRRELPVDVRVVELTAEEWSSSLEKRLVKCGLAESSSDARRKITQGGVRIDGHKAVLGSPPPAGEYLLQAGKLGAVRVRRKTD
jgi:tyrosyl-tRNA synthetase